MFRKLLLPFLFIAFFANMAFAQTGGITGTVTNEDGEPVPTANVLLVEISRGAATNLQGEYTIDNVEPGTYTLRVTFVGYQSYREEVTIESGQLLEKDVVLKQGAIGLDELIVTGYGGVQRKVETTGSIATVKVEELEEIPVLSAESLLQGRAAGVQVASSSGTPGGGFEVRVRGRSSINADSPPLYIVDGIPISTQNQAENVDQTPLSAINPDDIASIQVLKDAAAAAIYGARAANGVVLITTKSGSAGETQISLDFEQGFSKYNSRRDLLTSPEWIDYFGDAFGVPESDRLAFASDYGIDYTNLSSVDEVPTFDWQDYYYRTGISRSVDASVSGGSQEVRYYLSGSFEDIDGIIRSSDYRSYDFRANLDADFTTKFSSSINFSITNQHYNGVGEDSPSIGSPVSGITFLPPVYTAFLPNGEVNPNAPFGSSTAPATILKYRISRNSSTGILSNLRLNYDIAPWVSFSTMVGIDYRVIRDYGFRPPILARADNGSFNEGVATTTGFTSNATLNFRQTFNDEHNVSGLLGIEYHRDYTREVDATSIGFSTGNLLPTIGVGATPNTVAGFYDEFRLASYFGQLKYNYDERYFVNATLRYDGSSRFGVNNRWGIFPSLGLAWNITEEDFFNSDFVETLKLRVSYGVTGNSSIGLYQALGTYATSGSYLGVGGLTPSRLANDKLTWEEKKSINLGIDYSLFNGRLYGAIDAYRTNTTSLLLDRSLPAASGFSEITQNLGKVQNNGVEFVLNSINISTGDFIWSTSFNIAIQKNEVIKLNGAQQTLDPGDLIPVTVGHSILAWHTVKWAGVNPANGRPMWYDANGNITYRPTQADNIWFDGAGNDAVGGFGNTLSYKGLRLAVFFQYTYGKTAFPAQFWYFLQTPTFGTQAASTVLRRWQKPGDVTDIPLQVRGDSPLGSANWRTTRGTGSLFDASYIRLKTVTLSYNLPIALTEKINVRGVRLYVVGSNLITWTSWKGLDPEVTGTASQASYPNPLQVRAGIELDF